MLGMVIGDSWGHLYEFVTYNEDVNNIFIESLTAKEFSK
jgi:hypothetical protein